MEDYFQGDKEQEKISKINSAGLINITLENLWKDAYNAMAQQNLLLWNAKLDSIWLILGGDVNPNEVTSKGENKLHVIEENFNKIDKQIFETGSLTMKKTGFKQSSQEERRRIAKQYLLLKRKSLFLRKLQNSQGKGTAYDDTDDGDWE